MTNLFPLAVDLGDIIFLLVVLGGGLIQWLGSRKKNSPTSGDPFEPDFSPGEHESERTAKPEAEASWDELMEALGQKPGEVRPEQVAPPVPPALPAPPPTVPPVPHQAFTAAAATPELPQLSDHVRTLIRAMESRAASDASSAYETEDRSFPSARRAQAAIQSGGLGAALRNRSELRRAVILQEILQPPLALR
jgi:hypothetical protein